MIFPGLFSASTLERAAVESMRPMSERREAIENWRARLQIETANMDAEARTDLLVRIANRACRRYFGPKILKARRKTKWDEKTGKWE